ncbi:MAG TPA: hypothetical protein VM871_07780, partial [Flavisolibacter sp.]|nr:hypothetical protein [Flavisolibacter sp.]
PVIVIAFLQVTQAYIKSNREGRLSTETLVQLTLSAKDILWEEEGKELWIGTRLFDVASFSIIEGSYQVTGVYDNHETEVAGDVLHFLLNKDRNLLQLLLLLQCFAGILFVVQLIVANKACDKHFLPYLFFLSSLPCLVLSPPPRL